MTDLDDYADAGVDCVRIEGAEGQPYRLDSFETKKADDIGTEDFPVYGHWLDCTALSPSGSEFGPRYVEAPRDLAQELVDAGVTAGDSFVITSVDKTPDGAWDVTAVAWQPDQ